MNNHTIYVVDDNDVVRESLTQYLELKLGVNVEPYSSGIAFLNSDYNTDGTCLILDFRMPGFSGKEVLEQLVKKGDAIPTILISGQIEGVPNENERPKFVVDFLEKPYNTEEIITTIKAIMKNRSSL